MWNHNCKLSLIAFIVIALGFISVSNATAEQPSIERYLEIRAPGSPTLAPDGRLYVRDWPDGVNQLFRRDAGLDPDAPMTQLTDFPDGIRGYWLSPDGRHIIISGDVGGHEQWNLYHLDTETDEIVPLLDDHAVRYRFQLSLRDSSGFIYAANDVNPRDFYLYRYDLDSGESELLLDREKHWSADDITDDGSRVLISQYTSVAEADVYELNVASGELRSVNIKDGYYNEIAGYLPGENAVAIISDATNDLYRLHVKDLRTGAVTKPLADEFVGYEVDARWGSGWSTNHERSKVAVGFNIDGYSVLRVYHLPDFSPISIPVIERGVMAGTDIVNGMLIWQLSNARRPGITYTWQIDEEEQPRAITRVEDHGIDLSAFHEPELIIYESFDGKKIPAFLFLPPDYEQGTPIPFIAHYHGGPESQFRPRFNAAVQYLLTQGYGIIQPNVRGSTGYGRAFHMADVYTKRWDSVRDGVEAVRWLVDNGYTEEGRVAAYGRSYGGFMSVATVIEGQELYGASIKGVGIVNFVTFLEQTRDYRRHLREQQYGPLSDREFLESISPINRIDEINVPMMIVHGLNDPRVPVGEAMQLALGLQQRGHDPEQLYFHNEGHGMARLENRVLFWQRVVRFLDRTIGDNSLGR